MRGKKLGGMALIHGDCLEAMPKLKSEFFALILCDLPYGTTSCHWDVVIPFDALWQNYKRLLRPGGCVVLFGNQPFTSHLILSNLEWYKQSLVWNKNKCGSPGLAKVRPMQVHEDVVVFGPGKTTYNPQMEVGEPYARQSSSAEGYVGRVNNHGYGMNPRTSFVNEGTRYPKSIINISRDFSAQQQIHPTQKPVPLLEWLVKTYSNPNDCVLDNCMGSGSTGLACKTTGRRFIGIEKDELYFEAALARLASQMPFRPTK